MYISFLTIYIFSLTIGFSTTFGVFNNYYNNYRVIVVGAGPSGIAAATKLLENNISDIIILEAEDRYGGRVNTIQIHGKIVELGAEWCHGESGNLVYEMAKDYNLLIHDDDSNITEVLYSNGEVIDNALIEEILDFFSSISSLDNSEHENVPYRQFFLKNYENIVQKYQDDPKKMKFAIDAISTLEAILLTDVGAYSWEEYPPQSRYKMSRGDQAMIWNGVGYRTIFRMMMKLYETGVDILNILNKLHLRKRVERIEWQRDDEMRAIVTIDDGTIYIADHVIFTPSLGVLKHEHEKIFQPLLPPKKVEAIEMLGFDGVMKIICHFPVKWWAGGFVARTLIWTAEDKSNMPYEFPDAPILDGESWITHVPVIHYAENNPNALVAWVTGKIIEELENTPENIIKQGMMYIFEKFFGGSYNITEPEIVHTTWCTNPNFRGTYSFETVRSRETDDNWNSILSEPLTNHNGDAVVLFAGEATNPDHYATVHGAIESGYREAHRLLDFFSSTFPPHRQRNWDTLG